MKRLAALFGVLVIAAWLAAQPAERKPDLRPALSILRPVANDEGLREDAAVGEVVAAAVKGDATRGTLTLPEGSAVYEIATGDDGYAEVRFTWKGRPDVLIAALGARIPFDFGDDLAKVRVTVGAQERSTGVSWSLSGGSGVTYPAWMLGDSRDRSPAWRLGGILKDAENHYVVWKANRADTARVVVDRFGESAGWLRVTGSEQEACVLWNARSERDPVAVTVNQPAGTIDVWFHSPELPPRTAESLGLAPEKTASWKFKLGRGPVDK